MTKRQEFKVLQDFGSFELREYAPCVLAEVKVSADYSAAGSAAFGSLFGYISKGNKSAQKIAMTAPVIAAHSEAKSQSDEWFVSFVMPAGSTLDQMPVPNNSQVVLRELVAEKCVALPFRGRATEQLVARKVSELRTTAAGANILLTDEIRVCRFDPPFKPGILQYNEIVIPLVNQHQ